VIGDHTEELEIKDVEVSSEGPRNGDLLQERLTENGYWYGLNLLEQGLKAPH
jgi:hypothetical protein